MAGKIGIDLRRPGAKKTAQFILGMPDEEYLGFSYTAFKHDKRLPSIAMVDANQTAANLQYYYETEVLGVSQLAALTFPALECRTTAGQLKEAVDLAFKRYNVLKRKFSSSGLGEFLYAQLEMPFDEKKQNFYLHFPHLVRRLAELSKLPTVHIDGGTGSEAFPVSGLPRGWSGAECGRPLKTMLSKPVADPVVIIDEVDKAGVVHSSAGHSTSLHSALLGLLEPVSARDWPCPYFQVGFDMSHINWLMTCNDPERLPMLLRSRLRTIFVTPPSARQIGHFIEKEAIRRNLSPDDTECLVKKLHEQDRSIQGVSVRLVIRMMDELHRLATLPLKH